jgi:hypothetical protein
VFWLGRSDVFFGAKLRRPATTAHRSLMQQIGLPLDLDCRLQA